MRRKHKCPVCGYKFFIEKSLVYTVKEAHGISQILNGACQQIDVCDCPFCTCQNPLAVRLEPREESKFRSITLPFDLSDNNEAEVEVTEG